MGSRECYCGCDSPPEYHWCDGLYVSGYYCEDYARDKLPAKDELPVYGTSAGVVPIGGDSTIKTIEELEAHVAKA